MNLLFLRYGRQVAYRSLKVLLVNPEHTAAKKQEVEGHDKVNRTLITYLHIIMIRRRLILENI